MKEEIQISVRNLVEFVLRYGDIDNRRQASPDNAMQEGSRIHRMIQRRMGSEYQAEVPLKISFEEEGYLLTVEGRADGVIHHEGLVVIDEIKGVYRDPARWKAPMPLHLAQAKCYAYIYGLQQGLREIQVRMTYCHIPTEELRYFHMDYTLAELEQWFGQLMDSYRKWADYDWNWRKLRQASIQGLEFPFDYREGQKELVTNVYKTIYHKKKLFLEAPTGVGKTISTIYPAVQSVGQGRGNKIFYLTAKTITRTVAEDTLQQLRGKGLHFKSVILTAKEKICFMEEAECNPDYCPYAKGHYDRINDAVYDMLTSRESFSREGIEEYAEKHRVCPFELCLDMSLFADGVICDYNYLFDPHVYLKRFFADSAGGDYIFLIDEAHNLLERGREMYSAVLLKEQFLELRRELKQTVMSEITAKSRKHQVSGQMTLDMTEDMTDESEERPEDRLNHLTVVQAAQHKKGGRGAAGARSTLVRQGYADKILYQLEKCNQEMLAMKRECEQCRIVQEIDGFVQPLMRLQAVLDDYLAEQEEEPPAVRELLLDFYFEISHFLEIYELLDENYVKYTRLCDDGSFLLKLFCMNPAENLRRCMERGRSSILFSATFLPIQYYKKLLGGEAEDYEVYARSVFNPEKRALFIAGDVTSKYTRRSEEEYLNIARYIEEIVKNRHGNYMVFCPSYAFLQAVYEKYVENFGGEGRECMIQSEYMKEADRESFLARFQRNGEADLKAEAAMRTSVSMEIEEEEDDEDDDRILIGFCVLGGIFSEGIDLKNDDLIGAVIVGTGLPQVCFERELLKDFFHEGGEDGFDYSYRYPGMNKVLQAAGRVIRTVEDVGIVALLDERFLQFSYRRMFPREWERFDVVTVDTVAKQVERFWNEWL
ncbi:MAG: ATP-dependent DNA helicase [Butyrivibrio sp.]|nr:ATP-dependent DNA helicase [Acetatifactor muris]MCM1559043.1 ATP-dependent DNA helicase [Butyrivibrio sp.]